MKKCYQCLDSGVVLHHYPSGGGRIYPCSCKNRQQKLVEAQQKLEEKRKKLGIPD